MKSKHNFDIAKQPNNPIARIDCLVSALEEILTEKPKNKLVQASIPKLIKNISEYFLAYHYEIIDGHALHFEIKRVACNVSKTREISYDAALSSLVKDIFSGENQELVSLQSIFYRHNLTDIVQSAIADYLPKE